MREFGCYILFGASRNERNHCETTIKHTFRYTTYQTRQYYRSRVDKQRQYHKLLYIELTISFLIGRKRTVNFRNQRL